MAPPVPPPGPRSVGAILAEVDAWLGVLPFKAVMHDLARAGQSHYAMPGARTAAYNLFLQGGPGVGKSFSALRYAEMLHSLGITNGVTVRSSGAEPMELCEAARWHCAQAAGGVWIIDNAQGLTGGFSNRRVLDVICLAVKEAARPPVLILCGELNEQALMKTYPDCEWLFDRENRLTFEPLTPKETVRSLEHDAGVRGYGIPRRTLQRLRGRLPPTNLYHKRMLLNRAIIKHASRPGLRHRWTLDSIDFASVLHASPPPPPPPAKTVTFIISRDDLEASAEPDEMQDLVQDIGGDVDAAAGAQPLPSPPPTRPNGGAALAKMEALEGLEHVKQAMRDVVASARVGEARRAAGLAVEPPVLHAAFTGNPGTGKTTVARLYGELLCELGLLGPAGNGRVHEVDRSGLVGQYIGQTEKRVVTLLEKAKGGVLFIDEAHGLVPSEAPDDKDFGRLALDLIVKFMEDRRREIAIVFAGYADPMERLHHANPGLRSRLGQQLTFPDFDAPALTRILNQELARREYTLDPAAAKRICTKLLDLGKRDQAFANARSVRQVVDNAITVQAQRLSPEITESTTRETMMQLLEKDFFARDDGKPAKRDEPWRSMYT